MRFLRSTLLPSRLWALAAFAALGALIGCAAPEPPETLVELREITAGAELERAGEAAPDLVAESRRSLEASEAALARGDAALARRMAALGTIQARRAFAIVRQHQARQRESEALDAIERSRDDLARYRSQREDAEREIERLEALGRDEDRSRSSE